MDMEAGKTLTNEEVIRELLELLKKNAMKEQANDVFEICSYCLLYTSCHTLPLMLQGHSGTAQSSFLRNQCSHGVH